MLDQVSKWKVQSREAEERLAELTGDKSGDTKRLVWGVADEERFRGELDEKVRRRRGVGGLGRGGGKGREGRGGVMNAVTL